MTPYDYAATAGTQNWSGTVVSSFQQVWGSIASFVPALIVAIVVLIIGWIIAVAIGSLVAQVIRALKVDKLVEKTELKRALEKSKIHLDSGALLGSLVKWIIILGFLMASTEILSLPQITGYIGQVLGYLLNVVVAAIILGIGVALANFAQKFVKASLELAKLSSASLIATMAKWAILIFAFLAALSQLQIATYFINTLFMGIIAFLAIAGGLAFGIGGQDTARDFLHNLKREVSDREE
ncbi:hypothetical protein M1534_01175 [Patescibacteria group bacterium]|nr:hypothetical protein [Patescibacteria group bacterium]